MNVIVIVNDSFRWDYLGAYGNNRIRTPHLDRFAEQAAVFDWAYSEGLPTVPTRTTFFTGRYTFPFRGWQRLEPKDVLLAEILWNKGITSAMITDVYHLHKPSMAFERGFDTTEHIRGHEGDPWIVDPEIEVDVEAVHKPAPKDTAVRKQIEQYLRNVHWWQSEEDTFVARVMKAGLSWLQRQPRRDNLFLWLDCFDPHEPWDPPEPYRSWYVDPEYKGKDIIQPIPGDGSYLTAEELQHVKNLYSGKVSLCDRWVGWFLDEIQAMGMFEDTLILFTTDHGEPFGEHGYIKKSEPGLYEELCHIPLMVRHPEGLGAGRRFDAMVETTEVFPTVLDFLGVKAPPRIHGRSLLPLMRDEVDRVRDHAYMGYFKQAWRISDREWCFILNFLKGKGPELYHLASDPGEQDNLVHREPAKAMELELKLRQFVAGLK